MSELLVPSQTRPSGIKHVCTAPPATMSPVQFLMPERHSCENISNRRRNSSMLFTVQSWPRIPLSVVVIGKMCFSHHDSVLLGSLGWYCRTGAGAANISISPNSGWKCSGCEMISRSMDVCSLNHFCISSHSGKIKDNVHGCSHVNWSLPGKV